MIRSPLSPVNCFHLSIPLFFRINAVGTIPFQLSLRINPLFDVSRLLAIKCANGTRWRVAPCDGCECDGRGWLHKQQDGRRRGSFGALPPPPLGSARGCAATPAWPADERVVLRKERTRAYLVNSFRMSGRLKYWPSWAVLQSQPPPLVSPDLDPPLPRSPSTYPWRSAADSAIVKNKEYPTGGNLQDTTTYIAKWNIQNTISSASH